MIEWEEDPIIGMHSSIGQHKHDFIISKREHDYILHGMRDSSKKAAVGSLDHCKSEAEKILRKEQR